MNKYIYFEMIVLYVIFIPSVSASDKSHLADEWAEALDRTTEYVPFINTPAPLKKEFFRYSNVPVLISDSLKSDTIIVTYEMTDNSDTCFTNMYINNHSKTLNLVLENVSKANYNPDAEYTNVDSIEYNVKFINLTQTTWSNNPELPSPVSIIQYYRINDIMPIPLYVLERLRRNNIEATYVSVRIIRKQSNDFHYDTYSVVIPARL